MTDDIEVVPNYPPLRCNNCQWEGRSWPSDYLQDRVNEWRRHAIECPAAHNPQPVVKTQKRNRFEAVSLRVRLLAGTMLSGAFLLGYWLGKAA